MSYWHVDIRYLALGAFLAFVLPRLIAHMIVKAQDYLSARRKGERP